MNPRTYAKMMKINNRLEEFSQKTRITDLTVGRVTLNTGLILSGNAAGKFIKRVMNVKILDWVKNIDKLLSGEVSDKQIKAISFAIGGKACQKLHGTKLRKNLNTGTPWNAGTAGQNIGTKGPRPQEIKDKISQKNSGTRNGMFGVKMSDKEKEHLSNTMKDKILKGEFTPNSNNRNTHWESMFNGVKYRSSWEAWYQYVNPTAEYEILRISYVLGSATKIYIVDFIDHASKLVIEVKPKELCTGEVFEAKMKALTNWAINNQYDVLVVDKEWLIKNPVHTKDLVKFDEATIKKIKGLYEINKKN